jgi:hypothetical protein
MPKTAPFHSKKEDRYHDNSRCGPAREILPQNIEPGTGGKKHCEKCEELNRKGE